LSSVAARQKEELERVSAATRLAEGVDVQKLPLCGCAGGRLQTAWLYSLCNYGGVLDEHHDFVWRSYAPSKVKFFGWLMVRSRIQCRANLLRKGIIHLADSGCPICPASTETAGHIFFGCPFAQNFWSAIGVAPDPALDASAAGTCVLPAAARPRTASTLCLLCVWHLWKYRNDVVFNGLTPSLHLVLKRCRDDAVLWRARLPFACRDDVDLWLTFLLPERP
jgi:hypothetical protein